MTISTEREMILTPTRWPMFFLPLKRPVSGGGWPEIGVLRTATNDPNAEFQVAKNQNLYGGTVGGEVEMLTYKGVDALLADGWRVD